MENKVRRKVANLKQGLNEYFQFKNSLEYLMNFTKKYYIFSFGFDEMYYGLENVKTFRINKVICAFHWLITLYHLLLVISDDIFSLIDGPFLPDFYRTTLIFGVIIIFLVSVIKTDLLIGEIKFNFEPFRIFYFLMNDLKSKHKLNEANYKRLAILSKTLQLIMLKYATPILISLGIFILIRITILSQRFTWVFQTAIVTPFFVFSISTLTSCCCIVYIYFSYYKLLFDQINDKIKLFILNGNSNIINRRKENELLDLIHEHNLAAIQMNFMNLIIRRTGAAMFISFSFVKIITLYLIMNMEHILMKILMTNTFVIFFVFGFGLSILYSLQIKSAHKSHQLIHLIVCRYRMRLSFRLKVC